MSSFANNIAPLFVAVVVSTLGWLFGGTRGGLLLQVLPWLLAFLLEVLFVFPQRHFGETIYDARSRVWRALKRDPLTWVVFALLALLSVPFFNYGLCRSCDAALIAQGLSADPPVKFLPFCVDRLDHLNTVLWFAGALLTALIVRHALTAAGKRLAIEVVIWNGAVLALLGFVQQASGAPGPLWSTLHGLADGKVGEFFSTFGYPNMAGDYFTTLFCLSFGIWRLQYDEDVAERKASEALEADRKLGGMAFWKRYYFLIPTVMFFFAALNTLSRASIMLVTSAATVAFFHTLISFISKMSKVRRFKVGFISLLVLGLIAFSAALFMPEDIQREVNTLNTEEVLNRMTGKRQYHVRVATELWKDYPVFGCGGWGYLHFCIYKMTPDELKELQMVGGINVHNDYLQLLAEHGTVGFGLLLVAVWLLLSPVAVGWRALARTAAFMKGRHRPPKPIQIFVLPAPVFFTLVAAVCSFIHGFGDCPFRSAAVSSLFFAMLAAMSGFMPHLHNTQD